MIDSLHWHALNFRTAATEHADAMWQELEAFVERQIAAALAREWQTALKSAVSMKGNL